jgi:hypothetical protein
MSFEATLTDNSQKILYDVSFNNITANQITTQKTPTLALPFEFVDSVGLQNLTGVCNASLLIQGNLCTLVIPATTLIANFSGTTSHMFASADIPTPFIPVTGITTNAVLRDAAGNFLNSGNYVIDIIDQHITIVGLTQPNYGLGFANTVGTGYVIPAQNVTWVIA